jgi:hypothetical protein
MSIGRREEPSRRIPGTCPNPLLAWPHRPRPQARTRAIRLVGAILLEENDEWAVRRARYMTLETIAPLRDDLPLMLPAAAA